MSNNDDITNAFLGIRVGTSSEPMISEKKSITVDLSGILGGGKVAQKPSQGPFRATLRGSLKVTSEAKLLKAVNNFEKRVIKNDKFDGENKNIDHLVAKWFGADVTVESVKDGVLIVLDNDLELPSMFSALMANMAIGCEGNIHYSGQDGIKAIYRLANGKLTTENV